MADSASLITYKGKEIYHLDYTNKSSVSELVESIQNARAFRKVNIEEAGKQDVLMLVNLTNSFVFGEGWEELKRSGKELKDFTKKRALVGLNKSKKLLMNSFNLIANTDYKAFDTEGEAKEWLIQ